MNDAFNNDADTVLAVTLPLRDILLKLAFTALSEVRHVLTNEAFGHERDVDM